MTNRCTKPGRVRITLFSVTLAFLAALLALSCGDSPAEPDPLLPPTIPVRPALAPLWTLYESTDGPEWHRRDNWLTDAPVDTWHGVTVDDQGRVSALDLTRNNLSGVIPRELGELAGLGRLSLDGNDLGGPIPPELGNLVNLKVLRLDNNGLEGSIPPELGRLVALEDLRLQENELTSGIPPELGDLVSLHDLWLNGNNLTGSIPSELGSLPGLVTLGLQENRLSGAIPLQLGNLGALRHLWLHDNDLSGSVPPEVGRLASLSSLFLSNNPGLTGALPLSLTALDRLATLETDGTALCAPVDPDFQAWIRSVTRRVPRCLDDTGPTTVYLTQAVQSRSIPVPLVADRSAWLRVFVTASDTTSELVPPVRATFYLNGAETHVAEIPVGTGVIPTTVNEARLTASANAEIPGEVIRPGLELVVEIDPERTLDAGLGVARRIPEAGRMAVDVLEVADLNLTLIPFLWSEAPDSAIVATIDAVAADPEGHSLLRDTRTLLPVAGVNVTAHEPVLSSSNDAQELRSQTATIRAMERGTGHYMGMMSGSVAGPAGVAAIRGHTSFSRPFPSVIAHELGHNMSLQHAPCGDPSGVDPAYPHDDGSIGSWGWGHVRFGRRQMISPGRPDLMSYCYPRWISGYHFNKALLFRVLDEGVTAAAATVPGASGTRSLLLWGGVDVAGTPFLEPAFVVDAPTALPERGSGAFELAGWTAEGDVLFSLSFDMPVVADAEGSSAFTFLLPASAEWAGDLATITLSGPGGTATLDGDTDRPMVILRNPRTGQVRAFLRDPPPAALAGGAVDAGALSPEPGLEALFSRGLPGPREWRR